MRSENRIRLDMSIRDVVTNMCDGNPGALSVLMGLVTQTAHIDPDSMLGPLGPLGTLDGGGIYGPRIWMLYKHVCGQDMVATVGVLRAFQFGYVSANDLGYAIDNQGAGIDVPDLLAQVRARLPRFKPAAAAAAPEAVADPAG